MIYWIYLRSKAGSSVLLKVFQSARRLSDWPPDCLKGCRLCWVSDLKSSDTDCVTRKTLPGNTLAVSISQVNKLELLYYLTVAQLNGRSPCWSKSVTSPHTPLRVTGPFWPDTHMQTHKHTPRLACANIHLVQVMSPSRNVHLAAQKYTKMQSMQSLLAHTHTHSTVYSTVKCPYIMHAERHVQSLCFLGHHLLKIHYHFIWPELTVSPLTFVIFHLFIFLFIKKITK